MHACVWAPPAEGPEPHDPHPESCMLTLRPFYLCMHVGALASAHGRRRRVSLTPSCMLHAQPWHRQTQTQQQGRPGPHMRMQRASCLRRGCSSPHVDSAAHRNAWRALACRQSPLPQECNQEDGRGSTSLTGACIRKHVWRAWCVSGQSTGRGNVRCITIRLVVVALVVEVCARFQRRPAGT